VLHPDELHEKYVRTLASNHEWRVFRVNIYGLESAVFVWNHQLGFGLRIADTEGVEFDSFADALAGALNDR